MKKIVIVTWIGNGNFGTTLQSFALHRKLEILGYDTRILPDYNVGTSFKHYIKWGLSVLGVKLSRIKNFIKFDKLSSRKLKHFIKNNFNQIDKLYLPSELSKVVRSTDVFVTGSDQIWNTRYKFNPHNFLNFAENTKRMAYASSMGIDDFPEEHKPEVKRMLSKFSHIGLREKTAVKAVAKLLNRNDVIQVLDPTFLLTNEEWSRIGNNAKIEMCIPDKYILCYMIGKNSWYKEQLQKIQQKLGISHIVIVPAVENPNFLLDDAIIYDAAGPLEFIKLIKDATLVCTDSFHATALSINMSKNFIEFMRFKDEDKLSQNSRIYDILNHYGLMSKIYSDKIYDWVKDIDYKSVQAQLDADREKSINFLINSIEN